MATLARRVLKILLFLILYYLSLKYIHPYPITFTRSMTDKLITITNAIGFHDPELFYLLTVLLINTLITVALYELLMRTWINIRLRKKLTS